MKIIRTSEPLWIEAISTAYKNKDPVTLFDDANIGINPSEHTIFAMGKKASLSINHWVAVLISLGVAATGAYLLVMAILDPEPFSKLGLAISAGAVLMCGGGGTAVRILTNLKPPTVRVVPPLGFEISWS